MRESPTQNGSIIDRLALGAEIKPVRLDRVKIQGDLFETEPAKGRASKSDMIWAAKTFRDIVLPHIAQGGTRDELAALDREEGHTWFRRLAGAWDVYLGADLPNVEMAPNGSVTLVIGGRHRTLAAQLAGLTWIPMRVDHSGEG